MGDRDRILEAIWSKRVAVEQPDDLAELGTAIEYSDPLMKAKEMIAAVGGEVVMKDSEGYMEWKPEEDSLTIQGEFLVAENGAIWVEPVKGMERSSIFMAEHLIIEVSRKELVNNMHEAYARLIGRDFAYGTFISGPSKTADIEQSLVIGAQGPKSCTVVLY